MLSLLTPEYQKRMVQMNYHEAVNNSPQWNGVVLLSRRVHAVVVAGLARRDHRGHDEPAPGAVPDRHRRQPAAPGPHRPQARAEGAAVVSARPSASGTATRSSPGRRTCRAGRCRTRCSSSATRWRRSKSSRPSADGKTITVETTFYDPEAFTRPLHTVTPWERTRPIDDPEQRFTYVECRVQSTIVNGPDGRPTQLTPWIRVTSTTSGGRGPELGTAFRAGLEKPEN